VMGVSVLEGDVTDGTGTNTTVCVECCIQEKWPCSVQGRCGAGDGGGLLSLTNLQTAVGMHERFKWIDRLLRKEETIVIEWHKSVSAVAASASICNSAIATVTSGGVGGPKRSGALYALHSTLRYVRMYAQHTHTTLETLTHLSLIFGLCEFIFFVLWGVCYGPLINDNPVGEMDPTSLLSALRGGER
jgi:hypothetical protein